MNHGEKEAVVLEPIRDLIQSCSGVRLWAGVRKSGFSSSIPGGSLRCPPMSGGENQVYPMLRDSKARLFSCMGMDAG